jgi:hypothetical protein
VRYVERNDPELYYKLNREGEWNDEIRKTLVALIAEYAAVHRSPQKGMEA